MDRLAGPSARKTRCSRKSSAVRVRASCAAALAGGEPVLVQAPHRRQRLVEGRVAARSPACRSSSRRPATASRRGARQQLDARVVGQARAGSRRRARFPPATRSAAASPSITARCCDGRRRSASRAPSRPPRGRAVVRPGSPSSTSETSRQCAPPHFWYGWTPNPPSRFWPRSSPRTIGPEKKHVAIDGHVLSEHVASGQVANRRLARGEQELDRGGGIGGDRYVAQGSLSQ